MIKWNTISKTIHSYLSSSRSGDTSSMAMIFVTLCLQENYLKSQPAQLKRYDGPPKQLKELQLMDRAASSISDGDLVDALIHGYIILWLVEIIVAHINSSFRPEQHWSLMPLHAVCSTVRPASCMYGTGAHYGGPNGMAFPQ